MRIESSTTIRKPIAVVFASLAQVENWPAWSKAVVSTRWVSDEPMSVGATFLETTQFLGRRIEQSHEVTEYDPPQHFAFQATSGPFQQLTTFRFVQDPSGTRLTLSTQGDTGGFFRLVKPLLEGIALRQLKKELRDLKAWLEREEPSGNG